MAEQVHDNVNDIDETQLAELAITKALSASSLFTLSFPSGQYI